MKDRVIRVLGNFGVAFFTPLVGSQIVLDISYLQSIEIAFISAGLVTGLSLCREAANYGAQQNERQL